MLGSTTITTTISTTNMLDTRDSTTPIPRETWLSELPKPNHPQRHVKVPRPNAFREGTC